MTAARATALTGRAAGTGSARSHRESLAARLGGRDNALNLVRLVLALLVIYGHAFPLGGFAGFRLGPFVHGGWHGYAVWGFFAISGYLILGSAQRTPLLPFLWRRFLRIYPAYIVAIVLTAFAFAPLGHLIDPRVGFEVGNSLTFIAKSLDLRPGTFPVAQTPGVIPWQKEWNGSLWTLFYEACAYLATGLLMAIPWVRRHTAPVVGVLVAGFTVFYLADPGPEALARYLPEVPAVIVDAGLPLAAFFVWGMLARVLHTELSPRALPVTLALAVTALLLSTPAVPAPLRTAAVLPLLTYGVLGAGAIIPSRLGATNDLSYGMYVYAFPVQIIAVLAGVTRFGWFATASVCALATLPLAWASWWLVEKPALRWKSAVARVRSD